MKNSPKIESETCDLFDDFALITDDVVRNSNAWYHMWVDSNEIEEDMTFICMQD